MAERTSLGSTGLARYFTRPADANSRRVSTLATLLHQALLALGAEAGLGLEAR